MVDSAVTSDTEDGGHYQEDDGANSSCNKIGRSISSSSSAPLLLGDDENKSNGRGPKRKYGGFHKACDLNASTDDDMNTSHEG